MEGYASEKISSYTLIIGCITAASCQVQPIQRALSCEAQNKVLLIIRMTEQELGI